MWRGGRCRESEARVNVWTVRRNKNCRCSEAETRMNVWTVRRNKNCRCREVAVSGDWTVVDNRKERPYLVL